MEDKQITWRIFIAEFIGTFTLVFAGTGSMMVDIMTNGAIGNLGIAAAFGLAVMVMVYTIGAISGAHINPAVTIGFAVSKKIPIKRIPLYWSAQLSGAILASVSLKLLLGDIGNLGVTQPADSVLAALAMEVVLSLLLMMVILAVVSGGAEVKSQAAIAIGGMIALGSIVGGPISGASMNPARSFAPALISGVMSYNWLYWLAPIVGTSLGALIISSINPDSK